MFLRMYRKSAAALRDLGGQVMALVLVIFLADLVFGFFLSSFPVYARVAGMSLTLLGGVSTVSGLIQLGLALPIGLLSDRVGRSGLIAAGIATMTLGMLILSCSSGTLLLVLCLVMNGLGGIAAFQIGHAYLGDITTPAQRTLGFGLTTTAMAVGFGLGPYLGGVAVDCWGYKVAYLTGAAVGVITLVVALTTLRSRRTKGRRVTSGRILDGVRLMAREPNLRLAAFGNMMIGMTFAGTLSTFLPLYGKELHLTQSAIGALFGVRAGVSAVGRIMNTLFARRAGSLYVMLAALGFIAVATFGIGAATSPGAIAAFLSLEGLAYGGFMVGGLTFVSNHTTAENRGTAGGVYAMASGVGASLSPWLLGIVAETWGIRTVFFAAGVVLTTGVLIFALAMISLRRGKTAASGEAALPTARLS